MELPPTPAFTRPARCTIAPRTSGKLLRDKTGMPTDWRTCAPAAMVSLVRKKPHIATMLTSSQASTTLVHFITTLREASLLAPTPTLNPDVLRLP